MFDLDYKRMMYLFILCKALFLNPYYSFNPCHLGVGDIMEYFEKLFVGN